MTPELFDKLAGVLGACAVSFYDDDNCFNAISELSKRGLTQCNIHAILSTDTYQKCYDLIDKAATDPRLKGLNALVFLSLKPKGRGINMSPVRNVEAYRKLVEHAFEKNIGLGFDSCGAVNLLKSVQDRPDASRFTVLAESCESALMSLYCNVNGEFFPCSFTEGQKSWEKGIDFSRINSFKEDVWFSEKFMEFRKTLLETKNRNNFNCRECPFYDLSLSER
jgi:radical SAM protein with 4Fe4S-binding SPASM domain